MPLHVLVPGARYFIGPFVDGYYRANPDRTVVWVKPDGKEIPQDWGSEYLTRDPFEEINQHEAGLRVPQKKKPESEVKMNDFFLTADRAAALSNALKQVVSWDGLSGVKITIDSENITLTPHMKDIEIKR